MLPILYQRLIFLSYCVGLGTLITTAADIMKFENVFSPSNKFVIKDQFLYENLKTVYINQDKLKASRRFSPQSINDIMNIELLTLHLIKQQCEKINNQLVNATVTNPFHFLTSEYRTWDQARHECDVRGYKLAEVTTITEQHQLLETMVKHNLTQIAAGIYDQPKGHNEMLYISNHRSARLASIYETPCGPNGWGWKDWRDGNSDQRWAYSVKHNGLQVCRDLSMYAGTPVICQVKHSHLTVQTRLQRMHIECSDRVHNYREEYNTHWEIFTSILPSVALQPETSWFEINPGTIISSLSLDSLSKRQNNRKHPYPLLTLFDKDDTSDRKRKRRSPSFMQIFQNFIFNILQRRRNHASRYDKSEMGQSNTVLTPRHPNHIRHSALIKHFTPNQANETSYVAYKRRKAQLLRLTKTAKRSKRALSALTLASTVSGIASTVTNIFSGFRLSDQVEALIKSNKTVYEKFDEIDFQFHNLKSVVKQQANTLARVSEELELEMSLIQSSFIALQLDDTFHHLAAKVSNALTSLMITIQSALRGEVPGTLLTRKSLAEAAVRIRTKQGVDISQDPSLIHTHLTYDDATYWITFDIPIIDRSRKAIIHKAHALPMFDGDQMYIPRHKHPFFVASTQGNLFAPLDSIQTSRCLLSEDCHIDHPLWNYKAAPCGIAEFYGSPGNCKTYSSPSQNQFLTFGNETFFFVNGETKLLAECYKLQRSGWDKIFIVDGYGTIVSSPTCNIQTETGLLITPATDVMTMNPSNDIDELIYIYKNKPHQKPEFDLLFTSQIDSDINPKLKRLLIQADIDDRHAHYRSFTMAVINSTMVVITFMLIGALAFQSIKHKRHLMPLVVEWFKTKPDNNNTPTSDLNNGPIDKSPIIKNNRKNKPNIFFDKHQSKMHTIIGRDTNRNRYIYSSTDNNSNDHSNNSDRDLNTDLQFRMSVSSPEIEHPMSRLERHRQELVESHGKLLLPTHHFNLNN